MKALKLSVLCLSLFCGGILNASAYTLSTDTYSSLDDFLRLSIAGEHYVSFEPDGTIGNGGGTNIGSGITFIRNCQIMGDCGLDSSDPGIDDGWTFSGNTGDFHIVILSGTSTDDNAAVNDAYSYCTNGISTYEDCIAYSGIYVVGDELIEYVTAPTTTVTTTINIPDYSPYFDLFSFLALASWFVYMIQVFSKLTYKVV